MIFVTISMQQALCMQLQVRFTAGSRPLYLIVNVMSSFLRHKEQREMRDGFGQPAVELGTAGTSSSDMEIGTTTGKGKGQAAGQVLDPGGTAGFEEEPATDMTAEGTVSTDAA